MTDDEFVQIIERYASGQATEGEKRLVDKFIDSNERNQADPDQEVSETMWRHISASVEKEPVSAFSRRPWRILAVACSLLVISVVSFLGYQEYAGKTEEVITRTALPGEKSVITLTDGSKVYLNSGSSISFPKTFGKTREITLEGEAFFEVVRNPEQPFMVSTGDVVTKVLGTSFNIEAFSKDDIRVSVATGRVQVSELTDASHESPARTIFLNPSQQITFQNHHFNLDSIDIEKVTAWKSNTLRFDDAPLSVVGVLLSRWYGVTISFDNADIVNCRITGQYKDLQLEEVLRSIRYMYNIEYEMTNPDTIKLSGKGCKS